MNAAWQKLGGHPLIVEELIPFSREISLIGARGKDGSEVFYPPVENSHREGILRRSAAPAAIPALQLEEGRRQLSALMQALDYRGVLTIEYFDREGILVANEIAPRVHNSGHWTIEGAVTSQFENHVRAVLGFPLGDPSAFGPAVMLNLIGAVPNLEKMMQVTGAHLHLYGKEPRAGRKLGHVTCQGRNEDETNRAAKEIEALIAATAAPR
jgi:5-(carboxyamino)imidazole ribonucleotide synthase